MERIIREDNISLSNENIKIPKVLFVIGGVMGRGGIENYTMNYYRNIDKRNVQMDFAVFGEGTGAYDEEILNNGSKIYHIPSKRKNYFKHRKVLKDIFANEGYDIIHAEIDAMNAPVLKLAKKCNIPVRISHSHSTRHQTNNKIRYKIYEYEKNSIKKYATHLFACSEAAGRWMYGNKVVDNGKVEIIKNAIDIDKYVFNEKLRTEKREEYNIKDKFIIGHVGRISFEKNHKFMIDILKEIKKKKDNAMLILIGEGKLEEKIKKYAYDNNLQKDVLFLGNRDNVNELYNIFDVFILPSLFEGLPIVAIEAQANGLSCILSDNITKEVKLTNNVKILSLNNEDWVDIITKYDENSQRNNVKEQLKNKGYDIKTEAKKVEEKYISYVKRI